MPMQSMHKVRASLVTQPLIVVLTRLAEGFRQYGDVVELKAGIPAKIFCFRKPEHIKQIYAHKTIGIMKPPNIIKKAEWLMGNGSHNDLGDGWKHKRAVAAPSFERNNSQAICQRLPELLASFFPRWDAYAAEGTVTDIYYEMRRLVVDVSFELLFSENLGEQLDHVCEDTHFAESMFTTQSPIWFPSPSNIRYWKTGKRMQKLMHEIVEKHMGEPPPVDILSDLISRVDPELGRTWTNQEVVEEAFSIYFGASAMSSPLTWMLYLLAQHPLVLKKLRDEIANTVQGRNIKIEDIHQLPYLDMVFNETNRLYPPFWGSLRYSKEPIEIDGYAFPKKSMFLAIRYFAHRDPRYWKNPEAFDPERFSTENRGDYHPIAFFPFGAGPRACLGMHMAPIICKFIIATLISRYALEFRARFPNDPLIDFSFGVYPKDKIMMLIKRQSDIAFTSS